MNPYDRQSHHPRIGVPRRAVVPQGGTEISRGVDD